MYMCNEREREMCMVLFLCEGLYDSFGPVLLLPTEVKVMRNGKSLSRVRQTFVCVCARRRARALGSLRLSAAPFAQRLF